MKSTREAEVQLVAARGYFVLCILGPSPAAPAPRSSQRCCRCSKANKAGLQFGVQGKEKTSRVLRKVESRSVLLQDDTCSVSILAAGGMVGKEKRGTRAQVMKFKMKE